MRKDHDCPANWIIPQLKDAMPSAVPNFTCALKTEKATNPDDVEQCAPAALDQISPASFDGFWELGWQVRVCYVWGGLPSIPRLYVNVRRI